MSFAFNGWRPHASGPIAGGEEEGKIEMQNARKTQRITLKQSIHNGETKAPTRERKKPTCGVVCLCSSTPAVLPDCDLGDDGGELPVVRWCLGSVTSVVGREACRSRGWRLCSCWMSCNRWPEVVVEVVWVPHAVLENAGKVEAKMACWECGVA